MARGIAVMDPIMVVEMFWPVFISFAGGFLTRFFKKRKAKIGIVLGANVIALIAFACGSVDYMTTTVLMFVATLLGAWFDGLPGS